MTTNQRDKQRLKRAAQLVRDELQPRQAAENVLWRVPLRSKPTYTDGWFLKLGTLGRNQPHLELWLDRWPNRSVRDFYFGFYSPQPQIISRLMKRLPKHLSPVSTLSAGDYEQTRRGVWLLRDTLKRRDFNRPIYEHYHGCYCFFGMYHPTQDTTARGNRVAARRASAFFLEVLQTLPHAPAQKHEPTIYPRSENRQVVVRHLARERDSLLAEDCKIRDKYTCQVCGLRFEELYGELGREFAEAHHKVPLSHLEGEVKSTIDDLATVCANCHRMLHRMDGKRGDVANLRRLVRHHRKKM